MLEVRFAKKGEITRQKELWKNCFGDPEIYIDFFYANRYKEEETVLLLDDGEIAAMFTMIPVTTVTPDNRRIKTVMLYAVATDPKKQNQGFATRLMDFCDQYLTDNDYDLSVLVPANDRLFNFYGKRGFQNGFYIRETQLTPKMIENLPADKSRRCLIAPISAGEYNRRRNKQLDGRLYVAYRDEEIDYQKKLSLLSGADLYGITCENLQGCAAIERAPSDRLFIKEFLVQQELFNEAVRAIALQQSAKEYILRTPAYWGERLGGGIRPFAVVKHHRDIKVLITQKELGYLGFAYD